MVRRTTDNSAAKSRFRGGGVNGVGLSRYHVICCRYQSPWQMCCCLAFSVMTMMPPTCISGEIADLADVEEDPEEEAWQWMALTGP